MTGQDAASLLPEKRVEALENHRRPMARASPVPVPIPRVGTGNQFPEPAGTDGTANPAPLFEPYAAFCDRAENEPAIGWLLSGLVPSEGRVFIVSPPNVGKTWLALVLAKTAAAEGRHVFIVEEEGSARGLAERMRGLGIRRDAPIEMAHCRGVLLDDEVILGQIIDQLRHSVAPVVILDPLVSMSTGDENETRSANGLRQRLENMRQANPRLLLVVLHHTSKAGANGDRPGMMAARGSSVFSGWADVQLNLEGRGTPKGSGRVAFAISTVKMREGEKGPRQRMTITLGSGDVELTEEEEGETIGGQIIAMLKRNGSAMSGNEIAKGVGKRKQDVQKVLKGMFEDGSLTTDSQGRHMVPGSDAGSIDRGGDVP